MLLPTRLLGLPSKVLAVLFVLYDPVLLLAHLGAVPSHLACTALAHFDGFVEFITVETTGLILIHPQSEMILFNN